MTTATLPHGHAAARPARRGINLFLAVALAACATPAMAITPTAPPADAAPSVTVATQAPLDAVAPVDLASPDNAPLLAQITALQSAQNAPTTSSRIKSVLQRAFSLLGTPYRWGGTSPEGGFDCSGLVGYVFRTALGIELPRVSREMATKADAQLIKDRDELQQGDLVFFGRKGRVNHVGIYVGEGRFVHSPSTGKDVRVDSLVTGYWSGEFMQARRVAM